jgi:hypothetical protein
MSIRRLPLLPRGPRPYATLPDGTAIVPNANKLQQLKKYLDLDQKGMIMAEYVWVDADGETRSKSRVSGDQSIHLAFLPCPCFPISGLGIGLLAFAGPSVMASRVLSREAESRFAVFGGRALEWPITSNHKCGVVASAPFGPKPVMAERRRNSMTDAFSQAVGTDKQGIRWCILHWRVLHWRILHWSILRNQLKKAPLLTISPLLDSQGARLQARGPPRLELRRFLHQAGPWRQL